MGVPATGKDINFRGITWMTVKDGKVIEGWDSWNQGALLAELGIQ
jgi:predicted ester cyclase